MEIDGGRYRLIRRLGTGGTGVVYQAADLVLGRTVAVKALHGAFSPDLLHREGRSLGRLNHPNIVALHDLVESGGRAYLVMEYVDGCTLEQWLEEHGPLGPEQSVAVFRSIAAAVARAHEQGILHCDLKPANILISTSGDIKLTDFTLARIESGGGFHGIDGASVAYAAPEQLTQSGVDRRTDVYSLGVILRHMIGSPCAESGAAGRIAAAIERATATSPDDRFPSVDALLAALPAPAGGTTSIAAASPVSDLTRVRPDTAPTRETGPRFSWRLALLPAAAVLALAGAFSHFTASASPPPITLPDFVGAQSPSAQLIARSFALHTRIVHRYSAAPAGVVTAQRPAPGSRLDTPATVTLIVSEGPRPIPLPDVQGSSRTAAIDRLRRLGFRVVVRTHSTVFQSAGQVLSESPGPGAARLPHTVVTLTVSVKPWWWPF